MPFRSDAKTQGHVSRQPANAPRHVSPGTTPREAVSLKWEIKKFIALSTVLIVFMHCIARSEDYKLELSAYR